MICSLAGLIIAFNPNYGGPTPEQLEAYTKFQEFHFEIRMDDNQRSQYKEFLKQDYQPNRLQNDITSAEKIVSEWTKSDILGIWGKHSSMKQVDDIESSTEAMLNNGTIHGDGIAAQTRRETKSGCVSSKFLLSIIDKYRKPVRGDGTVSTSLFKQQIDATYEWTAIRMVLVAGKKIWDGSPANRTAVEKAILNHWDKLENDNKKQMSFLGDLRVNVMDWLVLRLGDYKFVSRMTPYQVREQLVNWGRDLVRIVPSLKPALDQRSKEFQAYLAKMSEKELKSEYERQQKFNTRFASYIQQKESERQGLQQSVASMRKSMLEFHVANLNISENLGNTGFTWTVSK